MLGVASGSQLGPLAMALVDQVAQGNSTDPGDPRGLAALLSPTPLRRPLGSLEANPGAAAAIDLSAFDEATSAPVSRMPSAMDRIKGGLDTPATQKSVTNPQTSRLSEELRDNLKMALNAAIASGNAEEVKRVVDDFCIEHMDVSTDIFVAATSESQRIIDEACDAGRSACGMRDDVKRHLQHRLLALRSEGLGANSGLARAASPNSYASLSPGRGGSASSGGTGGGGSSSSGAGNGGPGSSGGNGDGGSDGKGGNQIVDAGGLPVPGGTSPTADPGGASNQLVGVGGLYPAGEGDPNASILGTSVGVLVEHARDVRSQTTN